jgi:hypothetical protein
MSRPDVGLAVLVAVNPRCSTYLKALGGQFARVHDARRCRAGASGRTSRSRAVRPGKRLASELLIRGVAHAARSHRPCESRASRGRRHGPGIGAVDDTFFAQAELALIAAQQDAWGEAGRYARRAKALVEETRLGRGRVSARFDVLSLSGLIAVASRGTRGFLIGSANRRSWYCSRLRDVIRP